MKDLKTQIGIQLLRFTQRSFPSPSPIPRRLARVMSNHRQSHSYGRGELRELAIRSRGYEIEEINIENWLKIDSQGRKLT